MADEKIKKPAPKVKSEHGKPKEGCFRVVSYTYKGKGRNRQKIETVADIKKSDKTLPGDPDSKEKQKTLLECYKAKANDKNSKVIKVIE